MAVCDVDHPRYGRGHDLNTDRRDQVPQRDGTEGAWRDEEGNKRKRRHQRVVDDRCGQTLDDLLQTRVEIAQVFFGCAVWFWSVIVCLYRTARVNGRFPL